MKSDFSHNPEGASQSLTTGIQNMANALAEEIADKAAAEFKKRIKEKLVIGAAAILEREMSMTRVGDHLQITIKLKGGV